MMHSLVPNLFETLGRTRVLFGVAALLMNPALAPADETATPAFAFDDYLIAPLRVHLFTARDEPALCTTLTDADIERIIGKVNRIWSQAGVHFFVEALTREEPAPLTPTSKDAFGGDWGIRRRIPAATHAEQLFHVYYIKQFSVNGVCFPGAIFVKDTASLRPVEGGIDEPIPRVTSHELGHALGLPHRQDVTNLMASGTTGTKLNGSEIERARKTAASLSWFVRSSDLLSKAAALYDAGNVAEARASYQRLARLPLEAAIMKAIRARAAE